MAKREERRKVIELRKQGKTFTEIRNEIDVAKSTLHWWLTKHPLTKSQIKKIEKNKKKRRFLAIERIRATKARKRQERYNKTYNQECLQLLPLTDRELYLCGLFLYWGEGSKGLRSRTCLNNTDPKVMKFYLHWLVNALKIPKEKIKVEIHLYKDMDVKHTLNYWGRELHMPKKQFARPYIKNSKRRNIDHKGHGHGTCGLRVCDIRLKEKIYFGIESIADYYSRIMKEKLV